ncbi:MAG: phosphatase PAP2 family protein [bacterium]|nr:phosphatase PAP2 family protein [bacterium]
MIRTMIILMAALAWAPAAAQETYPYELDNGREAALVGAGGAVFLIGALVEAHAPADAGSVGDPATVPALDRTASRRWSPAANRVSDRLVNAQMLAPLALTVTGPGRERGGRLAVMYAETMLLNTGTTYALKRIFGRPRPFVFNDDPRIPGALRNSTTAYRSFPSGHSANAFASMVFFATTFERLHPDSGARGWVWGGCLAAATTTGLLRYTAGRHYPTDILAGALVGAAAGWLVPHLHEVDGDGGAGPTGGLKVAWGFGF